MNEQPRSLASTLFPVGLLLIAMASIQSGASLAKSMFPIAGAQGTTTLRLIFASLIMIALLRPGVQNSPRNPCAPSSSTE